MPYMTTRTLIHTHAHLQHGTMTGHNVKTVTARPWPAVHTVHISLLISASHSIPSFSFFLIKTVYSIMYYRVERELCCTRKVTL